MSYLAMWLPLVVDFALRSLGQCAIDANGLEQQASSSSRKVGLAYRAREQSQSLLGRRARLEVAAERERLCCVTHDQACKQDRILELCSVRLTGGYSNRLPEPTRLPSPGQPL